MDTLSPNQNKSKTIDVDGVSYDRFPIKTHVVTKDDDIIDIVKQYAMPHIQTDDMLFISERVVAITQGRSYPIDDIKPSTMAKFLVRFVHKSPYGIGLGSPWTMQLAIEEVGLPRILLGAVAAAVTKPFGIRGVFYRVCGRAAAAIDGPCDYTLPPYNKYATLAPKNPDKVAREVKEITGTDVIIVDANDLGVDILGTSSRDIDRSVAAQIFRDNPLGQSDEQTPLCLVRRS